MTDPALTLPAGNRRSFRTLNVLLGIAVLSALLFLAVAAFPYLRFQHDSFGQFPDFFWPRRYGLLLHIIGGMIALLAGPAQIWMGERRRPLPWHRTLGKIYLGGVALASGAAFYM